MKKLEEAGTAWPRMVKNWPAAAHGSTPGQHDMRAGDGRQGPATLGGEATAAAWQEGQGAVQRSPSPSDAAGALRGGEVDAAASSSGTVSRPPHQVR